MRFPRILFSLLAGVMILPISGCVSGSIPIAATAAPTAVWTISPGPTSSAAPAQMYSMAQLRAMVGSVRAVDGPAAVVMDDAQLKKIQGIQSLGSAWLRTDPAECLSLLHDGSLSDDRIQAAAALIGSRAGR